MNFLYISRLLSVIALFLSQIQTVQANPNYLICSGHVARMGYDYTGNVLTEILYQIGEHRFSTQLIKICSLKRNITTGGGKVITPSDCQQFQSTLQTQKTMGKRVLLYFSTPERERFEQETGATLTQARYTKNTCRYSSQASLKRLTPYAIYTN